MTSLETKRLILRPIELNDADDINSLCNDHAITSMTLLIPYPCALKDTTTWINIQKLACTEGTQANFVITLKDSDTIIGVIGLDIDKQHENAKLGYWIGRKFWNNGYASEAALAIIQYAFAQLKLHRIHASVIKENIASIKVLQKIGMQYEGCLKEHVKKDGIFKDLDKYAILSSNYKLKIS